MNFEEIENLEEQFQLATYAKMRIAVERGAGAWIWTSGGEKYLDLYGGHAVCATGHAHPKVAAALKAQAEKVLFYSNLVYSEVRAKAAEKLVEIAPRINHEGVFLQFGNRSQRKRDANGADVDEARKNNYIFRRFSRANGRCDFGDFFWETIEN